jgi:predicted ribosomally synthesized peptide with nif11-like leader
VSEDQLNAFLEKLTASEELQLKLRAAVDPDAVVEIAKSAGFELSAMAAKQAAMQADLLDSSVELSERDLESVAGGAAPPAASCESTAGCRCWTHD